MPAVGSALLRRATPADLEDIYRIEIACFKERRFRRDHVEWILRNDRAATFVEEDGSSLVGAIMLLVEGQVARILSVATMPDHRRRHLGTEMMKTAEDEARRRGCAQVRLEVSTRNYGAIEFYRGLGYKTDGVLYGYYSWGEDAYSMIRSVTTTDDVARAS
jgi:[ribosomal protein S18]-alanine N-acetyltransferase